MLYWQCTNELLKFSYGGYRLNVFFDHKQLLKILTNLHRLTGIRANILNYQGHDIRLNVAHAPFCQRINAIPEGHARCVACDAQAVLSAKESRGFYTYRCHAGLCEAILPIRPADGLPPMANLIYGQLLDESPLELQWEKSREALDWLPTETVEELRELFFHLRQYSAAELEAYSEILEILASHIQHEEMILNTDRTDLQKLQYYLDEHYTEKLSLASISSQLQIGRTKLCMLAKELSNGKTLSYLITQRRINAAKALLLKSDQPVSSVAEAVGIGDYNYFSKVFHSVTGTTPSAFRKAHRYNK